MSEYKSKSNFRMMAMALGLRDLFTPPRKKVREAGVKPGDSVLDFGCGPGSIAVAAAKRVGPAGFVYALDRDPQALESVGRKARKNRLDNIRTISSDKKTNLPEAGLDCVLMYDVFHELDDPNGVLREMSRILKPGGIMAANDHHLKEKKLTDRVLESGYFRLHRKAGVSVIFRRAN